MQKFLRTLMLAALLLPFASQAQELTVHDGTTTNGYVPVYGFYADAYLRSQFVYPAVELSEMAGGSISSMTFYASEASVDWGLANFEVKMTEISGTSLSAFDESASTSVFTGSLSISNNQMTVTFTTPYPYNGGNLLVEVDNLVIGTYVTSTWLGETVTGASVQGYSYSAFSSISGTQRNFLPKTTFTYEAGGDISCYPVKGLAVDESQTTTESITLTWIDTNNTDATYIVYTIAGTDTTEVDAANINITGTTAVITGLNANTPYTFGVKADCGNGDVTAMRTVNARTACGAITEFPWSENFESYASGTTDIPCWSNYRIVNGTGYGTLSSFKIYVGSNGSNSTHQLQLADMPAGTMTKLLLPEMNIPEGENYMFTLDVYRNTSSNPTEGIRVFVSADTNLDNATELAFISRNYTVGDSNLIPAEASSDWYNYELPLGMNGTVYIIIRGESQYGSSTYMDNFVVREMPTCIRVSNLTVVDTLTTTESITLTWESNGTNFIVYNMADSSVAATVTDTFATITELTSSTAYTFGVAVDCGDDDISDIVLVSGRTACGVMTMPWSENFDNWESKSPCWSFLQGQYNGGNGTPTTYSSAWALNTSYGDYITISGKALTMNLYSTNKYWAVTPQIEITSDDILFSVDAAVAAWSSATPNYDANDTLIIAIQNINDSTWTTLRTIPGSELNTLNNGYTTLYAPASGYNGDTVRFAIYGGSISGTNPYDNRMVIDNFSLVENTGDICYSPTGITVSNITSEGATLSWNGEADGYTIWDMSDTIVDQYVTDTFAIITALEPNTQYTFGITANCGDNESNMVTVTFHTPCMAFELPYTENFDSDSTFACWSMVDCESGTGMSTSTPYSGSGHFCFYYGYNPPQYLISPELSGADYGMQLSFMYRAYSSSWSETFQVGYSTTTNDVTAFTWGDETSCTSTTYAEYTQLMPAGTKFVAIKYTAYNQYYLYIDSMVFTPMDEDFCSPVTGLAVAEAGEESITLSWTSGASDFVILNMADTTEINATVENDTVTITGLTANTAYTFGVAVVCSSGNSDTMIINCRTACVAVTEFPWNENFERYASGTTDIPCWVNEHITGGGSYLFKVYTSSIGGNTTHTLQLPDMTSGTMTKLALPLMTIPEGENYLFSLDVYRNSSTANYAEGVRVFVSTSGEIEGATELAFISRSYTTANGIIPAEAASGWYTYTLPIDTTGNIYIILRGESRYGSATYMDNFVVRQMPSCPDVAGLALDSLDGTTAYVSWSSSEADSYEVEVRLNDTVATHVTTSIIDDTTAVLSDMIVDNDYQVYVRSVCGDNNGDWSLSPLAIHIGYCLPNPTSVDYDGITSISFGGMTNTTSHPTSAPYYMNNASMAGTVPASLDANVEITYATGYTYGTIIWVDWNNNMVFEGTEVVYAGTSENSNPTTLTATFNVPATTEPGDYRMRIAGADSYFDSYVTSIAAAAGANPCFTSTYAVVEDYTLTVTDAPTCFPVTDLTASSTDVTVTLTWTDDINSATYTIYNMSDTSEVATGVTGTTYTVTGLSASTSYTFGVVANCTPTDASMMATVAVATSCGAVTGFPFEETFDVMPACWTTIDADGDGDNWTVLSGYTAIQSASYSSGALTPDNWLITPPIAIPATGNYEVTWTATAQDQDWPAEHYGIFISTTGTDTANFTMIQEWTLSTGVFNPVIDLSNYAGQTIYIALRHFNCTDQFRLSIDNFIVREQAGANQVVINVNQNNPAYGSVTGAGTYNIGDSVTVSATPASGYTFNRWVDEDNITISSDNPYTFVATTNMTLKAMFLNSDATTYEVTVLVNDSTMGTATGSGTYAAGDIATLIATANPGYRFVNWTHTTSFGVTVFSTDDTTVVTVTSDKTYTANFEPGDPVVDSFTVTLNTTAGGTVSPMGSTIVAEGASFTATANPLTGYHFVAWMNGSTQVSTANPYTFTVTANTTLTATFEADAPGENYYTVTVNYDSTMGTVTGIPAEPVLEGSNVTLEATALTGHKFVAWVMNNDTVSHDASYTITNIVNNVTIYAIFKSTVSIEDAELSNVNIFSANSTIYVKGAEGQNIYIYDLNGRTIATKLNATETMEIPMEQTGVYLVRVGNASAKRVIVMR